MPRFYGLKIYYTVAIDFICPRFFHILSVNYLPWDTQQNIYKDHYYLKTVQVKALYIWNERLFMPTSDELGGQTFSGFQEHSFEAATVQKTLLYSVLNLRIKLAVIFASPNQAMLRLVFFFFP